MSDTKKVTDLEIYSGQLDESSDQILVVHNNTDTVRVPFSLFKTDQVSTSVPSTPGDSGSTGDISLAEDAVYTYVDGLWGKSPRELDWGATYLRIDENTPGVTEEQRDRLRDMVDVPLSTTNTPGLVKLADDASLDYDDPTDVPYSTTPRFVREYVLEHATGSGGNSFGLVSDYREDDTENAISGKGVSEALATLSIPEVATSYSPIDSDKVVTGSIVSTALQSFRANNITSVYSASSDMAMTGMGVASAIAAAKTDILNSIPDVTVDNTYNPTGTNAISGTGVSAALATLDIPTISDSYNETDHINGVTGYAVSEALGTLYIPAITDTYDPEDSSNGVSGRAVAEALNSVADIVAPEVVEALPMAGYNSPGLVTLGEPETLVGDTVKLLGLNGDGYPAIDTYGLSAYDIAVKNGYDGTEVAWLGSLHGASAYEVALENGYEGTEAEWLASLKGEKGDTGEVDAAAVNALIEDNIYTDAKTFTTVESSAKTNICYRWAQLTAPQYCPSASMLRRVIIPCRQTASSEMSSGPIYLGVFERKADATGETDADYTYLGTSINAVTQVVSTNSIWEFEEGLILSGRSVRLCAMPDRTTTTLDITEVFTIGSLGRQLNACRLKNYNGGTEYYKASVIFEVDAARFATNNMGAESVVYLTAAEKTKLDTLLANADSIISSLASTASETSSTTEEESTTTDEGTGTTTE